MAVTLLPQIVASLPLRRHFVLRMNPILLLGSLTPGALTVTAAMLLDSVNAPAALGHWCWLYICAYPVANILLDDLGSAHGGHLRHLNYSTPVL